MIGQTSRYLILVLLAILNTACENKKPIEAELAAKREEATELASKRKQLEKKYQDAVRASNKARIATPSAYQFDSINQKLQELEGQLEEAQSEDAIATAEAKRNQEKLGHYQSTFLKH